MKSIPLLEGVNQSLSKDMEALSSTGNYYDCDGSCFISARRFGKVLGGMDILVRNLCPDAFYYCLLFKAGSRPIIETNEDSTVIQVEKGRW